MRPLKGVNISGVETAVMRQLVLWRTFPWLQNKHAFFWHRMHTGLRLPLYTMWSCALLLMARTVELIYYFWLLLLTWLKSKWLPLAGNVSTLKATVSHLSSLSHSFILFSMKFPSDSLVVCAQKD